VPGLASEGAFTFDVAGLTLESSRDEVRGWSTPDGAGIGLYHFALPPDIDADLASVEALGRRVQERAAGSGAALVELSRIEVDGCPAVSQIVKIPQQPHGLSYVASIIVPFRDFSFVLKVQASERGMTGVRDAIVLDQAISDGRVSIAIDDGGNRTLKGWASDPFGPPGELRRLKRSLADDERYDELFPEHPLSIVRRTLRRLQPTIRLAPAVRAAPRFEHRPRAAPPPWWKFW
jgi:hypothetical protein